MCPVYCVREIEKFLCDTLRNHIRRGSYGKKVSYNKKNKISQTRAFLFSHGPFFACRTYAYVNWHEVV